MLSDVVPSRAVSSSGKVGRPPALLSPAARRPAPRALPAARSQTDAELSDLT